MPDNVDASHATDTPLVGETFTFGTLGKMAVVVAECSGYDAEACHAFNCCESMVVSACDACFGDSSAMTGVGDAMSAGFVPAEVKCEVDLECVRVRIMYILFRLGLLMLILFEMSVRVTV